MLAFLAIVGLVVLPAVASAAELSGTVKSVDAAKKSLVVTAEGKDHTVTWSDKTEVTHGDKKGSAADLKAGEKVKVTHEAGKASKIAIAK
jgi:hypothetical protein